MNKKGAKSGIKWEKHHLKIYKTFSLFTMADMSDDERYTISERSKNLYINNGKKYSIPPLIEGLSIVRNVMISTLSRSFIGSQISAMIKFGVRVQIARA